MKKLINCLLLLLPMWLSNHAWGESLYDFARCSDIPVYQGDSIVGLASPIVMGDKTTQAALETHLIQLANARSDISVCTESWQQLLPTFTPFAQADIPPPYYAWGIFLFAIVAGLLSVLLWPRTWRRHVTLLGLGSFALTSYALFIAAQYYVNQQQLPQRHFYKQLAYIQPAGIQHGRWIEIEGVNQFDSQLLAALPAAPKPVAPEHTVNLATANPAPSERATSMPASPELSSETPLSTQQAEQTHSPQKGDTRRVFQPLNFRSGPGIQFPLLQQRALAKHSVVTYIGPQEGDWWKIKLEDGSEGWVSSLWLR